METGFVKHPVLASARLSEKGKIVTAAEAVRLIHDGDTMAIDGFVGIGVAEGLLVALEERFLAGIPRPANRRASPAI
jgi:propionate CoA-transferase